MQKARSAQGGCWQVSLLQQLATALAAAAVALSPIGVPLAAPPPADAVLNSPNAQIPRSARGRNSIAQKYLTTSQDVLFPCTREKKFVRTSCLMQHRHGFTLPLNIYLFRKPASHVC